MITKSDKPLWKWQPARLLCKKKRKDVITYRVNAVATHKMRAKSDQVRKRKKIHYVMKSTKLDEKLEIPKRNNTKFKFKSFHITYETPLNALKSMHQHGMANRFQSQWATDAKKLQAFTTAENEQIKAFKTERYSTRTVGFRSKPSLVHSLPNVKLSAQIMWLFSNFWKILNLNFNFFLFIGGKTKTPFPVIIILRSKI